MKKIFIFSLAMLSLQPVMAQKHPFTIEDIYRVQYVSSPTVSADGVLAYTVSRSDLKAQKATTTVIVDGKPVSSDGKSFAPIWSQHDRSLYFCSNASGTTQVYRWKDGKAVQLTDYPLGTEGATVSPDGRYIAFAAEVFPDLGGADGKANKERMDKMDKNPLQAHIADSLFYRHWTTYSDGKFWHIIIFDTITKTYTDVTPGAFHSPVFSPGGPSGFVFSPDSRELCYTSNHDAHAEASTNCDLWTVPVTGGTPRNLTAGNKAWDGDPQYSPDGRYIAYRFQRTPSYESDRFVLGLIDRKTGRKTVLTEAFDNWVDAFKWSADSRSIFFMAPVCGYEPLYRVSLKDGRITTVVPHRAVSSFDVDRQGNLYYTYSRTDKPVALYKSSLGTGRRKGASAGFSETQLTHLNDSLEAAVDLRPSEALWIKGAEGDSVEVFVVKPHGFVEGKKYPLVINVHGGPQMQWMDSFRADWQVYPAAGYVVAYPNPHGSTGYGQKFCRDISGSWGGRPYEDVMKVTDMLASLSYVDSTRMGAMGWSYGGYFMNWLQGQTHRFKCLASMMGLFDLPSMWGTTEELWFPNFELEGQPWNSELYKKWSPSEYVRNFATPTLILTGERDYRVSYNQSLAYFNTLQTLGIPSRLIVFKNDGHWPSSLKSMPLYYNAHLEWFHKYLGGAPAPWDSRQMLVDLPYTK